MYNNEQLHVIRIHHSTMYDRQDDYDLDEDNEEYIEEDRDAEDQDDSDEGMCNV